MQAALTSQLTQHVPAQSRVKNRVLYTFIAFVLLLQLCPSVALAGSPSEVAQVPVWTNRAGETVCAFCSAITNQTVYLTLPSGGSRILPLSIFPEDEQMRMKRLLGVAPVPRCILPAWRLFESQLVAASDVESMRAVLGFLVKQIKKQADGNAVSREDEKYWVARAVEQERAARQVLLTREAQSGLQNPVSDVPQGREK